MILGGPAAAAGYDDYARGISANALGASDSAISFFSAAIAAGDLNAALLPLAYRGRALAYLRQDKCEPALADLDAAIKLAPGDWNIVWLHAEASACLNRLDTALADMSAVIAHMPMADAYMRRGRLRWRLADYAGAAEDFTRASQLQPKDAYAVLWLELSRLRGGTLDAAMVAKDVDRLDTDGWPRPLLALYAGAAKPDGIEAAAALGDDKAVPRQRCEAAFYLGEWWLARDKAAARPLLRNAAEICPHDTIENLQSRIELGRLP